MNDDDIKIVKLVNGEELICEVKGRSSEGINIRKIMQIMYTKIGSAAMFPYLSYCVFDELFLKESSILFVLDIDENKIINITTKEGEEQKNIKDQYKFLWSSIDSAENNIVLQ